MYFFIGEIANPLQTNKRLYAKYSSSQTYYYANVAGQIVKQRRTPVNIIYEDTEYFCDAEEYFKRLYHHHQYPTKMFTFKEYYFYHEDCPLIFMKHIQKVYSKWQDRKRDLVYKKLKILYNQSFDSSKSASKDDQNQDASGTAHFLLQISDYNPFSKKYYLRVQANRQMKLKLNEKNRTLKDISSLNHELSLMLNDMSQLSNISTLQQQQSPRFSSLYHPKKLKINYSSEYSTNHNSRSNSNSQSTIKFNFRKNKHSSRQKQKLVEQFHRNLQSKDKFQQKMVNLRQKLYSSQQRLVNFPRRQSPKYADKKLIGEQNNDKHSKSKSIFQISSFGSGKKGGLPLNLTSTKKEMLKLTTDKKVSSRYDKISLQSKALTRYESQKKVLIQSQSNKKIPHIMSTVIQKTNFQSLGKKNSAIINSSSHLNPISMLNRRTSQAIQASISKNNDFSDSKFQKNGQIKFRSHPSQYVSAPKHITQIRTNSPAKVSFKTNTEKVNLNKQKLHIQIGKKGNQLKIQ